MKGTDLIPVIGLSCMGLAGIITWLTNEYKSWRKDTGLWKRQKRGKLYDTLVSRYTEEERVSLMATLRDLDWSVREENYKSFKKLVTRVNVLDWSSFQKVLSIEMTKLPLLVNEKNDYIRKLTSWRMSVGK